MSGGAHDLAPGRPLRVEVDGLGLSLVDHGGAGHAGGHPPALLLHGGMAHARWWDFLAPLIAGAWRPLALDRRGHGDSDWTEPGRYGWERDLRDAEEVAARLDPGPWLLVGHSQGALVAVDLALRGILPVSGLVLLDVPLHLGTPGMRRAGASFAKIPQLRWESLETAVKAFRPFPPGHRIPSARLEHLARHSFRQTDEGGWTSKFHWKSFRRPQPGAPSPHLDFPERIRGIAVPTLCVRGGDSAILPAEDHRDMVGRIPAARAVEIPRTTHQLHAEDPEAVARAILEFAA